MKKYILIALLLMPISVLARSKTSCDYGLVSRLKGLASNVNITYSYEISNDMVKFNIELVNLNEDIYFVDNNTKNRYYYSDTVDGKITLNNYLSGKVSFTIYSNNSDCLDEKLTVKYVNLPYYNKYYKYDECRGVEDFYICQKWVKYDGGYSDFLDDINSYKKSLDTNSLIIEDDNKNWFDDFVGFFLSYYYIVMPIMILFIVNIIYLFKYIKFKKNRFEI